MITKITDAVVCHLRLLELIKSHIQKKKLQVEWLPLVKHIYDFLQGVSGSCKPCTSYDRDVCPSVCLSVRHTLTLCENDTS